MPVSRSLPVPKPLSAPIVSLSREDLTDVSDSQSVDYIPPELSPEHLMTLLFLLTAHLMARSFPVFLTSNSMNVFRTIFGLLVSTSRENTEPTATVLS